MSVRLLRHDVAVTPWPLENESVQCVVTSPPYWGLRDYGVSGQIGLERTPDEYVAKLVAVFREVRRALRKDGVVFLNLGDCYATGGGSGGVGHSAQVGSTRARVQGAGLLGHGLKPKDLVGIPWRVAFALQADGWWLRSDIVWAKPNPMPESIRDRPTRAHEFVFLFTKSARYYWDQDAIREPAAAASRARYAYAFPGAPDGLAQPNGGERLRPEGMREFTGTANARTVWTIATEPYPGAHFATFPTELARRCVLAGSRKGDLVLDPFSGAGTVALVSDRLDRSAVGLELNPEYVAMSRRRVESDAPLFAAQEPEPKPDENQAGMFEE